MPSVEIWYLEFQTVEFIIQIVEHVVDKTNLTAQK